MAPSLRFSGGRSAFGSNHRTLGQTHHCLRPTAVAHSKTDGRSVARRSFAPYAGSQVDGLYVEELDNPEEAETLIRDASTSAGMGYASGSEPLGNEWPTVSLRPDDPVSILPPLCKRLPLIHSPSCLTPPQIDRLPALCHVAAAERGGGPCHPESGTAHSREGCARTETASRAWCAPHILY